MDNQQFEQLMSSIREAGEIKRGTKRAARRRVVDEPDVQSIRHSFSLTQHQFAGLLGVSVRTLQNWEQGRRIPQGPARVLLRVAKERPDVLLEVLES